MYGIFAYIHHKFMVNVGKYSIHGASGFEFLSIITMSLLLIPALAGAFKYVFFVHPYLGR